jgi:putative flippase GtrA
MNIRFISIRLWNNLVPNKLGIQAIKHLLVGASGVLVNWVVFIVLRQFLNISTFVSTIIVNIILVLYIFPLQKYFTFINYSNTYQQFIRFILNSIVYLILDFVFAWFFIDFMKIVPACGKAMGLIILTPLSFISQRYWCFQVDNR